MSMLDKIKNMMKGHGEKAGQGIDKAGDFVDKKTQGKYEKQVDSVQEKMKKPFDEGGRKD